MEKPAIIEVLESAHLAHQAGDFVNALSFYEHFFDHALDDDPYALYGVRLSHCLNGWAELATVFPGAKQRLDAKQQNLLDEYFRHREPERFHDYLNVSRVLGLEQDALEQFLAFHQREPKSAAKLSKFVWDLLVQNAHWRVCSDLLQEPKHKLEELFAVFDEAAKMKDVDPVFDDIKFDRHIVTTLLDGVQDLITVLRNSHRSEEIAALNSQFQAALAQREHAELQRQSHAKSTFLFAGH